MEHSQTTSERLREMKKQCSAIHKKLVQAEADKTEAEVRADKAEAAVRSMGHQLAGTRDRLERAEAELKSLRPHHVEARS